MFPSSKILMELPKEEPIIIVFFPVPKVLQCTRCFRRCFSTMKNTFWVTDRPFGENCGRELGCCKCKPLSWGRDLFGSPPYSNADFQRKSSSSAIPQEEHDWKNIRKWAGISRSPKSVQQVWKRRAYCDTFTTTFFIAIAITTSGHHRSNFGNNSQVLWRT